MASTAHALTDAVVLRVPVELGREEAAELARQELADPVYAAAQPSLVERALRWVLERLADLSDRVGSASPGGIWGLVGLLAIAVLVVVAIRWRVGAVRRRRAVAAATFGAEDATADVSRARAERHAAAGEWALAVRARLRAIVRDLEDRGVLDRRPGRTADEVAREAGAALPDAAAALARAATTFDEVWYGHRTADADAYAVMVDADTRARAARRGSGATADLGPAVPR